MTFSELVDGRRAAVCARWLEAILADYGDETAARWRRERDPFANPVGHALAAALPALLDAALDGGEPAAGARAALETIVRIRSVQELAASRAVGFVGALRSAVREELAAELAGGAHAAALASLDTGVERLTLAAFDAYVRIREQVFRLRQEELRRSVGALLRRWHGQDAPAHDVVQLSPPAARGTPGGA
jgi:hypothetical protein